MAEKLPVKEVGGQLSRSHYCEKGEGTRKRTFYDRQEAIKEPDSTIEVAFTPRAA